MTTQRFDRDFELVIGIGSRAVVIRPPLRIVFSADKSVYGQLNTLKLRIYNLKEDHRLKIVKDAEQAVYLPLILRVGYKGSLEQIFRGSIHVAKTTPELPEIVTDIECIDGGFDIINSYSSRTIAGGEDYIEQLLNDMPNTGRGKLAEGTALIRPKVAVGPTMDLIRSGLKENEHAFIDDESLNVVRSATQVVDAVLPLVNARTGLINTPTRERQRVTAQTLMNPEVKIARRLLLESKFAPHLNGLYRVEKITYAGDNYGDQWQQSITGFLLPNYEVI